MGWLFGKKKKVPQVPLPAGKPFDKDSLQFPKKISTDNVIEPKEIKSAVGFDQPITSPEKIGKQETAMKPLKSLGERVLSPPRPQSMTMDSLEEPPQQEAITQGGNGELFVKVEVYQRILGELDLLKEEISKMSSAQKSLETSEYNEGLNFERLKKSMRQLHDNMLQIDKVLFKT